MTHTENTFVHIPLLARVHCKRLLICSKPLVSITLLMMMSLAGNPFDYPILALCQADPTALGLWVESLQLL